MSDPKLSNEQIDMWCTILDDIGSQDELTMKAMALEIRGHRSAKRANYETSVMLVERMLDGVMAASVLSAEDRQSLELLKGIAIVHRSSLNMGRTDPIIAEYLAKCECAVALIERLLGATP